MNIGIINDLYELMKSNIFTEEEKDYIYEFATFLANK